VKCAGPRRPLEGEEGERGVHRFRINLQTLSKKGVGRPRVARGGEKEEKKIGHGIPRARSRTEKDDLDLKRNL